MNETMPKEPAASIVSAIDDVLDDLRHAIGRLEHNDVDGADRAVTRAIGALVALRARPLQLDLTVATRVAEIMADAMKNADGMVRP